MTIPSLHHGLYMASLAAVLVMCVVANLSGKQLQEVVKSLRGDTREHKTRRSRGGHLQMLPELTADQIVPDATYRVAFTRGAGSGAMGAIASLLTDARVIRVDFYEELKRMAWQEKQP